MPRRRTPEPRECRGYPRWGLPPHPATVDDFTKRGEGLERVCRACSKEGDARRRAAQKQPEPEPEPTPIRKPKAQAETIVRRSRTERQPVIVAEVA